MSLNGTVEALTGAHPPPLKEVVFEVDRNVSINPKGLATCPVGTVEDQPPPERCRSAFLGKGTIKAEIEFPEGEPVEVKGRMLAFNQGVRDGETGIVAYAHFGPPVNGSIVTMAKVSKIHNGRSGSRWTLAFPKLAGGFGWIKEFSLTINRRFTYKGKRSGYLLAKCPDEHLAVRAAATFVDGSTGRGRFVRACATRD